MKMPTENIYVLDFSYDHDETIEELSYVDRIGINDAEIKNLIISGLVSIQRYGQVKWEAEGSYLMRYYDIIQLCKENKLFYKNERFYIYDPDNEYEDMRLKKYESYK
jgi:hypothetical protein